MVLNGDVAEICGIHAGDGYLRNDGKRRELDISGHVEEKTYYDNHVVPLFSKTFGIPIRARYFPHRNTYGFVTYDVDVVELMRYDFGFPYGAKSLIVQVPDFIMENRSLWPAFLRGYFDTDGCLSFDKKYGKHYQEFKRTRHCYPGIDLTTVSKPLAKDLGEIFQTLPFVYSYYICDPERGKENRRYRLALHGIENLRKWMNLIGTKNPVKYSRYLIWKKYGFCPVKISYAERLKILKGEINPHSCYGPVF